MSFLFGSKGNKAKAFRAPGYMDQGQLLNDLFIGNALGQNPELAGQLQSQYPDSGFNQYRPFSFGGFSPGQAIGGQADPTIQGLSFNQRSPFQFQAPQGNQFNLDPFNAQAAVHDAFTPQAQNIENILNRRGALEDRAIQEDLNRRGLLTSGATTQALGDRRQQTNDALSNALAQLAGTQANAQLGASQFQTQSQLAQQGQLYNQDFQRQLSQAEEIFRQQGATDSQAQAMAQDALARRGQKLQEFGVFNQTQRQPIEDLLRLFQLSAGGTPGNAGTPGLLQGLAGGVGQGIGTSLGGFFCLPKGTKIQTDLYDVNVEDVKVGDVVKGGTVIATVSRLRPDEHYFSKHQFDTGDVVMTFGHPYFDNLISHNPVENDSLCTYDIQTDSGHYYVNGVKLGSTLEVKNAV